MLTDVSITPVSGNAKTGPITVTGRPRRTCPLSCTFNPENPDGVGGCYTTGRIDAHYARTARDWAYEDVVAKLREGKSDRLRDRVDGDIVTPTGGMDLAYLETLTAAAREAGFNWVWGYTHTRDVIDWDLPNGYTMNASCETEGDVAEARLRGLPAVLSSDDYSHGDMIDGRRIVQCPATRSDKVDCSNCGGQAGPICARQGRETVVLFPLHGTAKRKAAESIRLRG